MSLTVFANFYIADRKKFEMLKLSFRSFNKAKIDQWIINVRGDYKKRVINYLKKNTKQDKIFYDLNSRKGWFYDSELMLKDLKSNNVFFWLEDHVNISSVRYFNSVVKDFDINSCEYLPYSHFFFGEHFKSFKSIKKKETKNLLVINYKLQAHHNRLKFMNENNISGSRYILVMPAFFSTRLFKKIIKSKFFFRHWPINTPFDFEKNEFAISWLPLKIGVLKKELFAVIDDNVGYPGYSLIERKHSIISKILKNNKTLKPNYATKNKINDKYLNFVNIVKHKLNNNYEVFKYSFFNFFK
jgi:hypothetical protein